MTEQDVCELLTLHVVDLCGFTRSIWLISAVAVCLEVDFAQTIVFEGCSTTPQVQNLDSMQTVDRLSYFFLDIRLVCRAYPRRRLFM